MLHRPPRPDPAARKRKSKREAMRRYRQRERDGKIAVPVEVDSRVNEMLIATEWLTEADAGDRSKIGKAIEAMLADSAKG